MTARNNNYTSSQIFMEILFQTRFLLHMMYAYLTGLIPVYMYSYFITKVIVAEFFLSNFEQFVRVESSHGRMTSWTIIWSLFLSEGSLKLLTSHGCEIPAQYVQVKSRKTFSIKLFDTFTVFHWYHHSRPLQHFQ
jgi:hypothetical protein